MAAIWTEYRGYMINTRVSPKRGFWEYKVTLKSPSGDVELILSSSVETMLFDDVDGAHGEAMIAAKSAIDERIMSSGLE